MQKKELEQVIKKIKKLLNKLNYLVIKLLQFIILLIYPHKCPSCKKIVDAEGFCSSCWKKLIFIEKPYCTVCGKPLDITTSMGLVCGSCIRKKYYFDRTFCVFAYNDTIARAIFEFKFYRKTFLSKFFTKLLANKIKDCRENIDFITCVPMHIKRLRQRGYNQSLLLVKDLSDMINVPYIPDLLIKIKHTKAQVQLNHKHRKTNLKSAFELNNKYVNVVKGKNILVVDDVFTTGSTVNECAKALKQQGDVARVFVLTLARALRSEQNILKPVVVQSLID